MAYRLSERDQWFIDMRRRDPLTGSEFVLHDNVVVCKKCRCVQRSDSWEFNNKKCVHCNGTLLEQFSREFVDISYHRDEDTPKKVKGFSIVESDNKYKDLRSFFSKIPFRRISRYVVLCCFCLTLALLLISIFKVGFNSFGYAIDNQLTYHEIQIDEKVSGLGDKIEQLNIVSFLSENRNKSYGTDIYEKSSVLAERISSLFHNGRASSIISAKSEYGTSLDAKTSTTGNRLTYFFSKIDSLFSKIVRKIGGVQLGEKINEIVENVQQAYREVEWYHVSRVVKHPKV